MTTINVSKEAYTRILEQKQKMEFRLQTLVSMSNALDALLEAKKDV